MVWGGHTLPSAAQQLDYRYILVRETVLKRIYTDIYFGAGYALDYHWDIV